MKVYHVEQGTEEWFACRRGKVTSSCVDDVLAKGRGGAPSVSRANYIAQLVSERLTGKVEESYTSPAMQFGIENEPYARGLYETTHDVLVEQVGFVVHPEIEMSGASPDGLVGDDGLVEIKCPNTASHLGYLLAGVAPSKYIPQMSWQMACTGRQYCDFVSFDPRMPPHLQLFVKRVERDDKYIAEVEAEVRKFLKEVDETIEKLENVCLA